MTATNPVKGIEDVYELTPIQQGLLFEQLRRPDAGVYIEQLLLTFEGELDTGAFGRAWQQVVDRHPILRTSFHWRDDRPPLQVVHAAATLPLEVLDWRDRAADRQAADLAAWMDAERVTGFALSDAPLMRISVVRVGPRTWWFVWRLSHLLMDGWSFGLAVTDFVAAYRGECLGHAPVWGPMRPYRDYAAWWAGRDGAYSREFWRTELDGFEPPEPIAVDGAPPAPGEPSHGFVELRLADIEAGLTALSRANQLTLNTLVQGAWLIVLAEHYGVTDVACGFTMAHRPAELPGSETILGPLIATMPVRERLEETRSALSWLRDLHRHIAAVREHTTLPLYEVQRLAGRATDVPLLESSVSYENMPMPDFALEETGVSMTGLHYDGRPHYPITMVIMPGDGMPLRVIHDRSRFGTGAAQRFCDRLRTVLATIVDRPELTVGELWAGATRPEPVGGTDAPTSAGDGRCLHDTLAGHARRRPDAVALSAGAERVTYGELDAWSDAVAARLVEAGVRPGSRVGLFAEPSAAMVAGMVATFKAGAAYVPLDPGQPPRRSADLVADAAVEAVLTTSDLVGRAPRGRPVCTVDDVPRDGQAPPLPDPDPDRPAYVLYTSGSTGRPKAVVVTHRNVASLLGAARDQFGACEHDVWTAAHAFTFDYSVWEIWGALGHGGRLVVVPRETVRSPAGFHRLVRDEQVTVCSQTPALFEHFAAADAQSEAGCPELRAVFVGGDRLPSSVLRGWIDRHGDERPRIYNLYGVTEATVVSTAHRVTATDTARDAPVPIGLPLVNQRVYVLDARGRPVPPGGTGELCTAGPAVAAGYLGDPGLTAARFGTEPVPPGERMYRTGDLVRPAADGTLVHLGRSDTQVKIRGHRVELGEIEAVLRTHPGVRSAVALARTDGSGAGSVVAHAVPEPGPDADGVPVDPERLREFAAERLPEHMVPAAIGWIDAIPTTPAGKVDLRALPEPAGAAEPHAGSVAPRTALEAELAGLLGRLLEVPSVGVHDRLADLGLHSAHLMRLMTAVRSRWGVELPLDRLVTAADLAELARLVEPGAA